MGRRGRVGEHPLTVDFALRLASSAARVLAPEGGTVLVGKDTRLSGYMFEAALEAGFVAAGVNVMLIGPLPTPGIAYMTKRFECDFGVVISASHNLYDDNGIKFFDDEGAKLSDEIEARIEQHLDEPPVTSVSSKLGRATRVDKSRVRYQEFCMSTVPGLDLTGMKVVIADIRRLVIFRRVNLLERVYWKNIPNRFDLIVCSNLLTFLSATAARQTVTNLTNSLREGGFLMVAPDEGPLVISRQLRQSKEHTSFFQRIG